MDENTLTFNLDAICEPAAKGIARAYVFAGLGLNAANDSRLTDFHLPGKAQFRFVPDAPSNELIANHKQEFSLWIIVNAMREATEAFGVFLDRLFESCLIAHDAANGRLRSQTKTLNEFRRAGNDGKLQRLFDKFGIKTGITDEFRSLTKARNCLSHRRALIGPQDCSDADKTKLVLEFWAWELFATQPDGSEIMLDDDALNPGGVLLKNGGTIAMRLTTRQLEYPLGSVLRLRPRDLTGIFVTFWTAVYNLRAAFVKFIEDLNMGRRTACSTGETVPVVVRYRVSDLEAWLNSCAMETAD